MAEQIFFEELMKFFFRLAAASILAGLSFTQANAALVSFTGNGQFSHLSGCSGCGIYSGGNALDMSGFNNSKLVITDITDSVATNANDVVIGKITWTNNASLFTDQNFNVRYTFTLSFTSPSVAIDSQQFTLNIKQPTNPAPDSVFNISNATLAGLGPFTLAGVTVSDIRFSLGGLGSYDGSTWKNPEHGVSTLYITADFTSAVPEPSTWAMMLIGFAGLGFVASRRKQAALAA
ncbi:MAG: hypothetical protein BGP06_20545 [Rhizobiales bacterium 65-9]|nr:MAG: hypothetical protein BGP06_20545 [Rhizobiales bacterium 65-9]